MVAHCSTVSARPVSLPCEEVSPKWHSHLILPSVEPLSDLPLEQQVELLLHVPNKYLLDETRTVWMQLKPTERINETQKENHCINSLTWGTWSCQIHRDRPSSGDCQGLGGVGNVELLLNRCRISLWEDKIVLEREHSDINCSNFFWLCLPKQRK